MHQKSVAGCLSVLRANGQRMQEVRTFGTTAAELLTLRDCLEGIESPSHEGTVVY